ncbi:TetR/AcrR family transcriptional regulator [Actinosynnema sp. NPDC020468]|uniref:TetR/AcrR family transcriptional regulator n=1 Tax=Actinosynnema sp. NPDC020468 TaxID=3154488 RepID=UPI0033EDB238
MARPKTITDERLLAAAAHVIGVRGPGFTVAEVAARAGVAVGTVAGRFGSKSGLLQALTRQESAALVERMRAAAVGLAPLEGLRAGLVAWFMPGMTDPTTTGNHLAQLGADLIDPELRALLAELYEATFGAVLELVRAVPLPRGPAPERAARVLTGLVYGVSMDWSIRPRGELVARLAEDVDAVLDAWKGK